MTFPLNHSRPPVPHPPHSRPPAALAPRPALSRAAAPTRAAALARLLLGAAVLCTAALLTACGPSAADGHPTAAARPTAAPASPPPSPSPSPSTAAALPVAPGAGMAHQTMARPRASGPQFRAMITDLWLAVRTGKPKYGLDAFFPVDAYKQVKAIDDPAADWRGRLWLDFTLDVKAAHRLLGPGAARARLVRVNVASADATWIDPGVCYNNIGYWHVANARVVYREHGQERSFGIASLISWRGVWYVVHFGGVVRPAVGMVDTPESGPGYPGPQGGC